MSDNPAADPTMDEILASIRRIISEEPAAPEPIPAAGPQNPTATIAHDETAPRAAEGPVHEDPMTDTRPDKGEPLVGEAAASASASAFDTLVATAQGAATAHPPITLPAPGRTLEDLTAELLRPMLKAWLDDNLADIVRESVDEEVRRIARGRVR